MSICDLLGMTFQVISKLNDELKSRTQYSLPYLCEVLLVVRHTCLKSSSLLIFLMSCERVYAAYCSISYHHNISIKLMVKIGTVGVLIPFISATTSTLIYGEVNGKCHRLRPSANDLLVLILITQAALMFLALPSIGAFILNIVLIGKIHKRNR